MTGPELDADGSHRAGVWLDDAPSDPTWAPPTAEDDRPRWPWQRFVTIGVPVLILALVVGVWALGGFAQREDTATSVAAGTTFVNGPLRFTFSRATVQQAEGYGKYKRIQKVVVIGTVQNTSNAALSPSGDWFLARGPGESAIQTGQSASIGDPNQYDAPDDVTPGLPAVPIRVEFDFPPSFKPGGSIVFASRTLSYATHSYFSSGDSKFWDKGGIGIYKMTLPLSRLAPQPSY